MHVEGHGRVDDESCRAATKSASKAARARQEHGKNRRGRAVAACSTRFAIGSRFSSTSVYTTGSHSHLCYIAASVLFHTIAQIAAHSTRVAEGLRPSRPVPDNTRLGRHTVAPAIPSHSKQNRRATTRPRSRARTIDSLEATITTPPLSRLRVSSPGPGRSWATAGVVV